MNLPPGHEAILREALRAPSAHNAQPWTLRRHADGYELHYNHLDYLPHDPDDRDAYLAIGGFLETLDLAAQRHGHRSSVEPRYRRAGSDLYVGLVRLRPARPGEPVDPLAVPAAGRHTNLYPYDRTDLPEPLRQALRELGCTLVDPPAMARLVARASALSWRDRRFVTDLARWTSGDRHAPAGMTPWGLSLARYEWLALRAAVRVGYLPGPLARIYAGRDVRLLARARAVAVLGADDLNAPTLVDAGRRLLRCWVAIHAAGFACHPISVAVDRPETARDVAATAAVAVPVAVFRVGRPTRPAPDSNRRPLRDVLRDD